MGWKRADAEGAGGISGHVGAYSFVACLSHLTIDHASLSRQSTTPTPARHLQHLGAHYVFFFHILHRNFSITLSLSCFAFCGHHLSPRTAMAFPLSSAPNISMPHSFFFFSSPLTHPVPPCILNILPLCVLYSTALPQGHICAYSSSSRLLVCLFLLSGTSRSSTLNRSFSVFT